jgi:hypothetical protein
MYQTTQRRTSEDINHHDTRRENLKSHDLTLFISFPPFCTSI